jgi:hypothetical protein
MHLHPLVAAKYSVTMVSPLGVRGRAAFLDKEVYRVLAQRAAERGGLFLKPKFKSLPRQPSLSIVERERGG